MSELVLFVSCLTRQNIDFDVEEGENSFSFLLKEVTQDL